VVADPPVREETDIKTTPKTGKLKPNDPLGNISPMDMVDGEKQYIPWDAGNAAWVQLKLYES
jgi:hypothetical protein